MATQPQLRAYIDRPVVVGIRPEQFRATGPSQDGRAPATLKARVGLVEPLGAEQLVHVSLPGIEPHHVDFEPQTPDMEAFDEDETEPIVRRFVARLGGDAQVHPDEVVELGIEVDRLHWFDPDTGDALDG